jgi:hypothetical protein
MDLLVPVGHLQAAFGLGSRSLHRFDQVIRFLRIQACFEDREIDLLLFGKVQLDDRIEAVEDTPRRPRQLEAVLMPLKGLVVTCNEVNGDFIA